MDKIDALISSFLEHSGSQYYDPVKAHEYYMRTRQLKGRRSTTALKSQSQKEGWSYVQSRIKEDKKTELEAAKNTNKAAVEQLRAAGDQRRKELAAKIKSIIQSKIDAIPKSLGKHARAAEVAKLRAASKPEMDQLRTDIKATIESARASYKQARDDITKKFEAKLDSEFDAIRTNVR
jgi:hypothetical protein